MLFGFQYEKLAFLVDAPNLLHEIYHKGKLNFTSRNESVGVGVARRAKPKTVRKCSAIPRVCWTAMAHDLRPRSKSLQALFRWQRRTDQAQPILAN
jgi:chloramphenicol O-acetyltransferase